MPPTTLPFRERIIQNVATTLRTINGGTTYFNTVKTGSVVADPNVNIMNVPITELPYIIVEPTASGTRFYQPASLIKNLFQVLITARQDATGIDLDRKMKTWERMYHDIETALLVDRTRGGIAYDTRIDEPAPAADVGPGQMTLLVVPVTIHYIRTFGRP